MKKVFCFLFVLVTNILSYSQTTDISNCIKWDRDRKLKFDDFKARIDSAKLMEYSRIINLKKHIFDSLIANKINPESELYYPIPSRFDSLKISCTIVGGYSVDSNSIHFNLMACFEPLNSYAVKKTAIVLASAQIQFNIYELYTRKIKKMLSEIKKQNASQELVDHKASLFQTFCDQEVSEFKDDLKRSKGKVINVNSNWDEKINKELELLKDYGQSEGKILIKD